MLNRSTSQSISHCFLLDSETREVAEALLSNVDLVAEGLAEAFDELEISALRETYLVRLAIPSSRSDLADLATQLESQFSAKGVSFASRQIPPEDMTLFSGKAGLLTSMLWALSGVVLLNEVPLEPRETYNLASAANELVQGGKYLAVRKKGLFARRYRFALIRDHSIGELLRPGEAALRDGHSVADLLRVMESKCERSKLMSL